MKEIHGFSTNCLFSVMLICVMAFFSCSDGKDELPSETKPAQPTTVIESLTQSSLSFTEGAGEQTFSFTANADWSIDVAESRSASWCTVFPTSGSKGKQTIKVTTLDNDTYDDRSVTITLNAGTESKSIVVTQKQKNALLLTTDKYEVEQNGGLITVEVKANVNYTATIDEGCRDWIKESKGSRSLTTTTKVFDIEASGELEKREGTIIFSDGTLSETVHVYQTGGPIVLLTQNKIFAESSGETIKVELKSNCNYEVIMPNVDWIEEEVTRGMSSHTLYYSVASNNTYDDREAKVLFMSKENRSIVDTLTIHQAQKDAIIVSEKEVHIGHEGGIIDVKIDSNIEFEMLTFNVDWISETSTRALATHIKQLKIDENTSEEAREAKVYFINRFNGIEDSLCIFQSAKTKRLKIHVETPGTLVDLIGDDIKFKIDELEISGYIGGKDMVLIREMAKKSLLYLDMSDVNTVADGVSFLKTSIVGGTPEEPIFTEKDCYLESNNICDFMFFRCRAIQTIILPKNISKIGEYAFDECSELKTVVIHDNTASIIGKGAFSSCSKLTYLVLSNGITEIAENAFAYCKNLKTINIPESVRKIKSGAFSMDVSNKPQTTLNIQKQSFLFY